MILLFAFAAVVQLNDANPFMWAFVYSAACVVSILYAAKKENQFVVVGLAIFSGIWAATMIPELTLNGFQYMFADVNMLQSGVKEAREFLGLLIVFGWTIVIALSPSSGISREN